MRPFSCPTCAGLVFFENSLCLSCGTALAFARAERDIVALSQSEDGLAFTDSGGRVLRPCANLTLASCNWLADASTGHGLCDCCLLTRTRPADGDEAAMAAFARAEAAKRRLVYQIDDLGLPLVPRTADPEHGLAFDLLSSASEGVVTGHAGGIITIDLAEGDDGYRETIRVRLDEPYRTLLGHFRHEVGHWYWDVLVDGTPALQSFRELFGDERADYGQALQQHYAEPEPPGWEKTHVSVYATAHPWEDWAETFAHYLHIRDSLQTAAAFGIVVEGPKIPLRVDPDAPLDAEPSDRPRDFEDIVDTWLPLTFALNAVNRSMGRGDLYPFVLSPAVLDKLRFAHELVTASGRAEA